MDKNMLDVKDYKGRGYMPLVDYSLWRVAVLNTPPARPAKRTRKVSRHMETDEVFILVEGRAVLVIGGKSSKPRDKLKTVKMKENLMYNVKKRTWHTALLAKGSKIIIVENRKTTLRNSPRYVLNPDQNSFLASLEKRHKLFMD